MSELSCTRNSENVTITFDEWWRKKAFEMMARPDYGAEEIARDAWEAAQPKWTYCKDGMPTEKDGKFEGTGIFNSSVFNVLHSNGTVASMYYYKKLKAFGTSDGVKIYSCNDVIAWMPLPEVPNVHDD